MVHLLWLSQYLKVTWLVSEGAETVAVCCCRLLHMLHEADPTDLESDPEQLLQLEGLFRYYLLL